MVKISLDLKLSEEESERALETFYCKRFGWSREGRKGKNCRIWHDNWGYQIGNAELIRYFKDPNLKLRACDGKQLGMVGALTIMAIVYHSNNTSFWRSCYFMQKFMSKNLGFEIPVENFSE